MMTDKTQNSKHRDRSQYFKEYRKRKKIENLFHLVPREQLIREENSLEKKGNVFFLVRFLPLFIILITSYLVYLTSAVLEGPRILNVIISMTVEIMLLILISLEFQTKIEKAMKTSLVIGFSIYTLVPILSAPILEENKQTEDRLLFRKTIDSIENEISMHKDKMELFKIQGKDMQVLAETNKILRLSELLRNTTSANTDHIGAQPMQSTKIPVWALLLQRVLFSICNLFLTHTWVTHLKKQDKQGDNLNAQSVTMCEPDDNTYGLKMRRI